MSYACPNCGKVCQRKYGLTNHMKSCNAPNRKGEEVIRPGENNDIGAFLIAQEHVCVLLDLNFCAALGQFILDQDSDNKAILAFGHRLAKLADNYAEQ